MNADIICFSKNRMIVIVELRQASALRIKGRSNFPNWGPLAYRGLPGR